MSRTRTANPNSGALTIGAAGLFVLLVGIYLIASPPITMTLENRIVTLVDETLSIPPRWELKTQVLKNETISVPPLWERVERLWFEDEVRVATYDRDRKSILKGRYYYPIGGDYVITGRATEGSLKAFNFYVLDMENEQKWYWREPFSALFGGEGRTSYDFSLSFSSYEDMPLIYFGIEKRDQGQELRVQIMCNVSYLRRNCAFCSFRPSFGPYPRDTDSVIFNCTVEETSRKSFDFYYFGSRVSYEEMAGYSPIGLRGYQARYEAKNASRASFSYFLIYSATGGYGEGFYLENPYSGDNLTVRLLVTTTNLVENPATIYSKVVMTQAPWNYSSKMEYVTSPRLNVYVEPILPLPIYFTLLDYENYLRCRADIPYEQRIAGKYLLLAENFTVPLSTEESVLPFYLFFINSKGEYGPVPVYVSARLSWTEKIMSPLLVGGMPPGILLVVMGVAIVVMGVVRMRKPLVDSESEKTPPVVGNSRS